MKTSDRSLIAATIFALGAAPALANADTLFTSSNLAAGNTVIEYDQAANGSLTLIAEYPTGGTGTDSGLGNQGALTTDGEFLFVVNAGSDDVSAFRITDTGLQQTDRVSSGGDRPVSVTVDRGVLYVLNAGSDNIAGFRVDAEGGLSPIGGSSRLLSTVGTAPAQIGFSDDGRVLVVTEKATNRLVTFPVDRDGVAGTAQVFDSPGQTPFGFAMTKGRRVLVSEAAGGGAGASSVTSWRVSPQGSLDVLDPVVPTLQSAACWVAVTPDGRFAYTTNTASGNVSGYRIKGGDLELLTADGISAVTGSGTAPIDMAVSSNGRFLHTLNAGSDSIATFRIGNDGSLTPVAETRGLPDRANGLLAL